MRNKLLSGVAGAVTLALGLAAPAMAAPGNANINGSPAPNSTTSPATVTIPTGQTIVNPTVNFKGWTNSLLWIHLCKKQGSDPTWGGYASECDPYTEVSANNFTPAAGGSTTDFALLVNDVNNTGGNPPWYCKTPNGPAPASGVTAVDTCYVRITQGTPGNEADATYIQLNLLDETGVPEVPTNIILPLGAAAAVAGAGYMALRRRSSALAA